MTYDSIVLSSGHGKYIRGASGLPEGLEEVDEARKIVEALAEELRARGTRVVTFHDNTSHDQSTNLSTIVAAHNRETRELDISVHLNAYESTSKLMGCEVLYYSENKLAGELSAAIAAAAGWPDRGPKQRTDLYFLAHTNMPAVLLEICFCDSTGDKKLYLEHFDDIITNLADRLAGYGDVAPPEPEAPDVALHVLGKCSSFGGPGDTSGMTADEGLAFVYQQGDKPELFLPGKSLDSQALGRDLNPYVHYFACRFDYDVTPEESLLEHVGLVRNATTGFALTAMPADWGPNANTNRVCDLSPSLMADLALSTDDLVEIIYPWEP